MNDPRSPFSQLFKPFRDVPTAKAELGIATGGEGHFSWIPAAGGALRVHDAFSILAFAALERGKTQVCVTSRHTALWGEELPGPMTAVTTTIHLGFWTLACLAISRICGTAADRSRVLSSM